MALAQKISYYAIKTTSDKEQGNQTYLGMKLNLSRICADFSWPKHYLYSMHIFLNIIKKIVLKYKGRSKHSGFMYILHHFTEDTLHFDICGEF